MIIDIQEANAEPILLTYPDSASINEVLGNVCKDVPNITAFTEDDQATHKVLIE
jgi:uncharacterized protein (DUF1015 family)